VKKLLATSLLSLAVMATCDAQSVIVYSEAFGSASAPLEVNSGDFPIDLSLPQFNTALGPLDSVILSLTTTVTGSLGAINLTSVAQPFTDAFASVPITLTDPSGQTLTQTTAATLASGTANAGFLTVTYLPTVTGTATGSSFTSSLAAYEAAGAPGMVELEVSSDQNATVGGASSAGALAFFGTANVYGEVQVAYTYGTEIPEPADCAGLLGMASAGWVLCRLLRRTGVGEKGLGLHRT
jgi:hypothetical protein